MTKSVPEWDLQNYVLALMKISGKRIHTTEVIPSGFDQFPKFETLMLGLKYDQESGWFSLDEDILG